MFGPRRKRTKVQTNTCFHWRTVLCSKHLSVKIIRKLRNAISQGPNVTGGVREQRCWCRPPIGGHKQCQVTDMIDGETFSYTLKRRSSELCAHTCRVIARGGTRSWSSLLSRRRSTTSCRKRAEKKQSQSQSQRQRTWLVIMVFIFKYWTGISNHWIMVIFTNGTLQVFTCFFSLFLAHRVFTRYGQTDIVTCSLYLVMELWKWLIDIIWGAPMHFCLFASVIWLSELWK